MILRSLKKRRITVPSRTAARKILKLVRGQASRLGLGTWLLLGGISGLNTATTLAAEPPIFFTPADARPISSVGQSLSADEIQAKRNAWASAQAALKTTPQATSNNSGGLKWRSSAAAKPTVEPQPLEQPAAEVQPAEFSLSAPANGEVATCEGNCELDSNSAPLSMSSVRQVNHEAAIDPFNDPFGDGGQPGSLRLAQHQPRLAQSPRGGIQGSAGSNFNQPTPAAPQYGEPTPAQPRDLPPMTNPQQDFKLPETSDQVPNADQMNGGDSSAPLIKPDNSLRNSDGTFRKLAPGESCDRRYNERDCCESERLCQSARKFIRDSDIRNISIDITPRFKPDAPSWDEDYGTRDEKLKLADSRQWLDRGGNVLVQGRLIDLANGKAVIQSDGGTIERISLNVLAEDELCFINGWWSLPTECVAEGTPFQMRQWTPSTFAYAASGLCHKPLYFEEVQAERYGHVAGPLLQPVLSGAHFFLNVAVLPYKMGINPPTECQYALGYYRPGSCAPWMIPPVPLSVRGAAFQTGAVVGGIFLFP